MGRISFLLYCPVLIISLVGCIPLAHLNTNSNPSVLVQTNGDTDVETGQRLFEQRNFSEALTSFERALDKPLKVYSKSIVLTAIGNCYNELNQFEISLKFYARAIREDPKNYKAYVNQGIVHRLMGNYDKAAKSYAIALKLKPDYAELHASMGALSVFQENYTEAIKHLEHAIKLDDSLAVAHSNLAIAYASVGRFDAADKQLQKAIARGYHQPQVIRERIEQLRTRINGSSPTANP
jgi:tetratricopeptide (TPR) repeat protein